MSFIALSVLLLGGWSSSGHAAPEPAPELSPREVVSIQLNALKTPDDPEPDAGIATAFAFAHPANKAVTGPLPRFIRMLKGPQYSDLLGHRSHALEVVETGGERVIFAVTVTTQEGQLLGYRWQVDKVADGELAGAWMTTAVSPPVPLGQGI